MSVVGSDGGHELIIRVGNKGGKRCTVSSCKWALRVQLETREMFEFLSRKMARVDV